MFGSGDLAALDMDGTVIWSTNLAREYGNLANQFGYSSSPLLWKEMLFVQILRRTKPYSSSAGDGTPLESMIVALNSLTGKPVWKHIRKNSALDESMRRGGRSPLHAPRFACTYQPAPV